jgi:hypothetical protein
VPSPVHAGVFAPGGSASFAGLWLDNDDNTDFNCLAAAARVAPNILSLDSVLEIVRERTRDEARVDAVRALYGQVKIRHVQPDEGSRLEYEEYTKPGWTQMREGIIVEAMKVGTRNPIY